jgi:hypothetical protein
MTHVMKSDPFSADRTQAGRIQADPSSSGDLRLPEIDPKAISAGEFRSLIWSSGAVLLRNAVPADIVLPLGEEIGRMLEHFDSIPPTVLEREMQSEDPGRKSIWSEIINDGVHYNYDLVVFSKGRHSLFDPFRKSVLAGLIREAWPNAEIRENPAANVRRIFPKKTAAYADEPLTPHVDAMFHQHDTLGVNFWVPLTTAGTDRPGLAVIPMGVEETKSYLDYSRLGHKRREIDFAFTNHFRHEKLGLDSLRKSGLYGQFVSPHLNPGDALAFTNFTIHATYINEIMTLPRTSIECRVLIEPVRSEPAKRARRMAKPLRQWFSRRLERTS